MLNWLNIYKVYLKLKDRSLFSAKDELFSPYAFWETFPRWRPHPFGYRDLTGNFFCWQIPKPDKPEKLQVS